MDPRRHTRAPGGTLASAKLYIYVSTGQKERHSNFSTAETSTRRDCRVSENRLWQTSYPSTNPLFLCLLETSNSICVYVYRQYLVWSSNSCVSTCPHSPINTEVLQRVILTACARISRIMLWNCAEDGVQLCLWQLIKVPWLLGRRLK